MDEKEFNQIAYQNAFNKEKYDRVGLMLPKGEKDKLRSHAAKNGESLNAFIIRAIRETMEREAK
ncbi:MAG: Arc family DNA-binding protein [Clostridia bacterium]|nr:Arc family DNA-binding protein [Clostridia bacterium]